MLTNQSNCQTYTISAGASAYQFPVPFHDPSELYVAVRDNSSGTTTPLERGSAAGAGYYTIPAQDSYLSGGVAVTLNSATRSAYEGKTLVVTRNVPLNQLLDLPLAGRLDTESLEKSLDRLVMMAQQLQEQLGRTLQYPQGAPYNREAAYRFFELMNANIEEWLSQCSEAVDAARRALSAASAGSSYLSATSNCMSFASHHAAVAAAYTNVASGYKDQASACMVSAGGYMSQASGYAANASSAASVAAGSAAQSAVASALSGKQDKLPTGPNGHVWTMVDGGMQWAPPSAEPGGGSAIQVDSSLNSSSTNPVANKAVWSALSSKAGLSNGKVVSSQLPVAGSGSASKGVVYAGDRGIGVLPNGGLYIQSATSGQISSRSNTYNPVLPAQINLAVKAALTDSNHITLLPAEQKTARDIFGAVGENHSHAISKVTGLQDALTGLVAHVDSFAEVSAEWISNPAIRGREKVYICRGENTTDLDEMLKGHIYHLQLFPETYEYTYEDTQWEAEWVPGTGWSGHWEEVKETALVLPSSFGAAAGTYYLIDGVWTRPASGNAPAYYIGNSGWTGWAFAGWYAGPDTDVAAAYQEDTDCIVDGPYYCVANYSWVPNTDGSSQMAAALAAAVEQYSSEVVTGVDWVASGSGAVVWHAHTVTKTATGFTIDYLWRDITPIGNAAGSIVVPAETFGEISDYWRQNYGESGWDDVIAIGYGQHSASMVNKMNEVSSGNDYVGRGNIFKIWFYQEREALYKVGEDTEPEGTTRRSLPAGGTWTAITGAGILKVLRYDVKSSNNVLLRRLYAHVSRRDGSNAYIDYLVENMSKIDPDYSTSDVYELPGESGVVSPGEVYCLAMEEDFTLETEWDGVGGSSYGESVLFVEPGAYTFSVDEGITLDPSVLMTSGYRYRLLVSFTPFGVFVEQTAEWEIPAPSGQVTLTFSGTVPTGAGWTIDGQTYTSGQTATLSPGTYAITYASVTGYDSPSTPTSVTVAADDTLTLSAEYTEQQSAPSADYIVSGCNVTDANGGYNQDTTKTGLKGSKVYRNANNFYLAYGTNDRGGGGWYINPTLYADEMMASPSVGPVAGTSSQVPTTGWPSGMTVTQGN